MPACTGERESRSPEPFTLVILHRERANQVFGKHQARLLVFFATTRSPSKSGVTAYRCLQRRLLRSVRRTVFVPSARTAAPAQYVSRYQIQFIIIFYEIIFMMYVLFSILESCMLGLILVMLNLARNLNLQLSIFPTPCLLYRNYK